MKLPFTWSILDSDAACSEIPQDTLLELRISHIERIQNEGIVYAIQKQIRALAVIGLACVPASVAFGYVGIRNQDPRLTVAGLLGVVCSVRSTKEIYKAIDVNKNLTEQNALMDRNLNQVIAGSMADNLLLRELIEEEAGVAYRDIPIEPTFIAENR